MRYTIFHTYQDVESSAFSGGYLRNGENGYSFTEAIALIMDAAYSAMGSQGTIEITGNGHRGIEDWDEMLFRVTVTTDTDKNTWSLCGE